MRERAGAFRWGSRRATARTRGTVPVVAVVAWAAVAGACSDGTDRPSAAGDTVPAAASATTVTDGVGTTTPTTLAAVASTTTVTAVAGSSATTSTASTTSTTSTASTTIVEPAVDELEAEIAAAYDVIYRGYWDCLRSPLGCDLSWLAPDSGSSRAMLATMEALADRDRFVGDDDVGYYVIESIEIAETGTEATVVTCWWSTAVLYTAPADPTRPAGPDNPATIVNNTPSSGRQLDELALVDGRWLQSGGRLLGDDSEEDQCGR